MNIATATSVNAQNIRLVPVGDKSARKSFVRVPWNIYGNDSNWVPPLLIEREGHIDPKQNPYFDHAEVQLWIAYKDELPVGRISAQIDQESLERHKDDAGHFGFLEGQEDPEIFQALLDTAEAWLRERGMKKIVGPLSFSINDEVGLLVDGFDRPPSLMMGHAFPYYGRYLEDMGYQKAVDTIAYDFDVNKDGLNDKSRAIVNRLASNPKVTVRSLNKKDFDNELRRVIDIFNDAWWDNWGFVPINEAEIKKLASDFKLILEPEHVSIIEVDGEPAAFGLTIPNLNEAIRDLNGRLLPFGWAKLGYRIITKSIRSARLPFMGVRRKYQKSWMGAAMCLIIIDMVHSRNVGKKDQAELSWVLEENYGVRKIIESTGCKPYKTYRVYQKSLI